MTLFFRQFLTWRFFMTLFFSTFFDMALFFHDIFWHDICCNRRLPITIWGVKYVSERPAGRPAVSVMSRFLGTLFGNAFLMSGVWSWSGGGRGVFGGFSTRWVRFRHPFRPRKHLDGSARWCPCQERSNECSCQWWHGVGGDLVQEGRNLRLLHALKASYLY